MIYPKFLSGQLKKEQAIGITAPSDGNGKPMDIQRLDLAKQTLTGLGYPVVETENVRQSDGRGRSSSKEERASQLMELFRNPEVKYIFAAKGGDFLMEVLPLLDFEEIRRNPKWVQGFSDSTGLTYTIAVHCGIGTVYGNHFNDFAMKPWHAAVHNNFEIMRGNLIEQSTFDFYENDFYDRASPSDGYREDKRCKQYAIYEGEEVPRVHIEGRLLGGCLDVLFDLVGTSFDKTAEFVEAYREDGILWYLESFSLDSESITRGLWQLKNAGWFEGAKGFVFGRPCMFQSFTDHSYREAVEVILSELHVPVVFDADIGHKAPQFTIINGAYGIWEYEHGKSKLSMKKSVR